MEIQLNKILMNRTRKYLSPVLKAYGKEFETQIHTVFKLAFGIGDILLVNSDVSLTSHIFFLVDTSIDTPAVHEFQKWIRQQEYYTKDYAYDNIETGHLHMFVIKYPEQYFGSLELFRQSKYSRMFENNPEVINEYITNPETKKILIKDNSYLLEFSEKLNEVFGSNMKLTPEDIHPSYEFDLPIELEDEVFDQKTILQKLTRGE